MKNLIVVAVIALISLRSMAYFYEYVDGVKWLYTVENGKAILGGGTSSSQTISKNKSGAITIPSKLGAFPVTGIGDYAFFCCSKLTNVTIPTGVVDIRKDAFYGCSSLKSVVIPSSIMRIGEYAFSNSGLKSITLPASVTNVGNRAFGSCGNLESVSICEGVTSIGEFAFEYCNGLKNVNIPSTLKDIANSSFRECRNLSNLTISEGVENIGTDAFYFCCGLKKVVIPQSVTNIGNWAFEYCKSMTNIVVSTGTIVGAGAFYGCSGLADGDGFVIVNNAVYDYDERSDTAIVPDGVTRIDVGAFGMYDSKLANVILPSSMSSIGEVAFWNCYKLTNIVFNGDSPEVEQDAFKCVASGCTASVYYGSKGWDGDGDGYWNKLKLKYLAREGQVGFTEKCDFMLDGLDSKLSVPLEWMITNGVAKKGDAVSDAIATMVAIGRNGIPRYQSYILGMDPDSNILAEEQLKVTINGFDVNGAPVIDYHPTPNDSSHITVKKLGTKLLGDDWEEVPTGHEADYNFFKVTVEMK